MSTNEAYVAASNGDVLRTRSIVRVMEPSRWSSKAILGIKGTPFKLRPSSNTDTDAHVEEFVDPHANKDDAQLADSSEPRKFDSSDVKKLDRSIRITSKDLEYFGYSDGCPRSMDLQAGHSKSKPADKIQEYGSSPPKLRDGTRVDFLNGVPPVFQIWISQIFRRSRSQWTTPSLDENEE